MEAWTLTRCDTDPTASAFWQEAVRAYQAALDAAVDNRERCTAWLGLTAVKRVTDDLAGAVADLAQAEAMAVRYGLVAEQAPNSFSARQSVFSARRPRGLPAGTWDRAGIGATCRAVELEAMALGGLGDAEYVRGRMISAYDRFRQCVELSERHGFGRIEEEIGLDDGVTALQQLGILKAA